MKNVIEKLSLGIVLAATGAIIAIAFFTKGGRHSFWLIPLCLSSVTGIFAGSAFGNRQHLLSKNISLTLFWLSLHAAVVTTVVAVSAK